MVQKVCKETAGDFDPRMRLLAFSELFGRLQLNIATALVAALAIPWRTTDVFTLSASDWDSVAAFTLRFLTQRRVFTPAAVPLNLIKSVIALPRSLTHVGLPLDKATDDRMAHFHVRPVPLS